LGVSNIQDIRNRSSGTSIEETCVA